MFICFKLPKNAEMLYCGRKQKLSEEFRGALSRGLERLQGNNIIVGNLNFLP
jgi:hypothetical protein